MKKIIKTGDRTEFTFSAGIPQELPVGATTSCLGIFELPDQVLNFRVCGGPAQNQYGFFTQHGYGRGGKDTVHDGQIVGGTVDEEDENLIKALFRELLEETGIVFCDETQLPEPIVTKVFNSTAGRMGQGRLDIVFRYQVSLEQRFTVTTVSAPDEAFVTNDPLVWNTRAKLGTVEKLTVPQMISRMHGMSSSSPRHPWPEVCCPELVSREYYITHMSRNRMPVAWLVFNGNGSEFTISEVKK